MKTTFLLIGLIFCSLATADEKPEIRSLEATLGTNGRLAWEFHQLIEDKYGFGLRYPGYIIGIEKAVRGRIGVVSRDKLDSHIKLNLVNKLERLHLINWLNDPKRTFVSHIVQYELHQTRMNKTLPHLRSNIIYSAYQEINKKLSNTKRIYQKSWSVIQSMQSQLESEIKSSHYTHVIVLSMGWNTDQQEAIRNFNSLIGNLLNKAYRHKNVKFKPLVIGITWPSKWYVPGVSILNKANDADEIGAIWINLLLHRVLLPLKSKTGVKVVLIGHSLGARAITRAVFSEKLLPDNLNTVNAKADLVIGFQGAFSINRFIRKKGVEGYPYANFKNKAGKFVMTWSKNDTATPFLKYIANINLIGSIWGYKSSQKEGHKDLFTQSTSDRYGNLNLYDTSTKKILYIDASSIIKYRRYRKYGKAHNDLYTAELGNLMWNLLYQFTIIRK